MPNIGIVDAPAATPGTLPVRWRGDYRQAVLVLGTAQLGGSYGPAQADVTGTDATVGLLRAATSLGLTHIDTARAYGFSETRLGAAFRHLTPSPLNLVTKVAPLAEVMASEQFAALDPAAAATAAVEASVARSIAELGTHQRLTLLLHRSGDAQLAGGAAWQRLRGYLHDGTAHRIGVTVQHPGDLWTALELPDLGYLQVPCNILDHRWRDLRISGALMARPDLVITARSVFLQGLLAAGRAVRWPKLHDDDRDQIVQLLDKMAEELGRTGRDDLCLAYLLSMPWLTSVVVGAETGDQLRQHASLAVRDPLTLTERDWVTSHLPKVPEELLDPLRWRS